MIVIIVSLLLSHWTSVNITSLLSMSAVIGFEQEVYTLSERAASYSLSVTTVRGFLPQDLVLGVSAIPDTACENTWICNTHKLPLDLSDFYKCIETLKLICHESLQLSSIYDGQTIIAFCKTNLSNNC